MTLPSKRTRRDASFFDYTPWAGYIFSSLLCDMVNSVANAYTCSLDLPILVFCGRSDDQTYGGVKARKVGPPPLLSELRWSGRPGLDALFWRRGLRFWDNGRRLFQF